MRRIACVRGTTRFPRTRGRYSVVGTGYKLQHGKNDREVCRQVLTSFETTKMHNQLKEGKAFAAYEGDPRRPPP